jgi:hypothetical protein
MPKPKLLAMILLAGVARLGAQTAPTPGQSGGTQGQNQSQNQDQSQGQTGQTQDQNQTPEENVAATQSAETRVPTPLPLSIDSNMLEFSPELARSNFLQAGVSAGASYDTNLLNQSTNEV